VISGLEPDDALKAKWEEEARKKRDQVRDFNKCFHFMGIEGNSRLNFDFNLLKEGKNDKSGNSMAERVLLKVLQKLNGMAPFLLLRPLNIY